jgi:hypothetical protein
MGARQSNRSQQGAHAEARRRIAKQARQAQAALADYLGAGEPIVAAQVLIESYTDCRFAYLGGEDDEQHLRV